jgi:excisionase family DNA binding protein
MADKVVFALPDGRWLVLSEETFAVGLAEGSRVMSARAAEGGEPLLGAEALSQVLGIPSSWIEQKAREGVIPSLEFGRWRRFRRSEVEAAVRSSAGDRA